MILCSPKPYGERIWFLTVYLSKLQLRGSEVILLTEHFSTLICIWSRTQDVSNEFALVAEVIFASRVDNSALVLTSDYICDVTAGVNAPDAAGMCWICGAIKDQS